MAKGKRGYEEQRAAELAYAEEYRRRLRRQHRSTSGDITPVISEEERLANEALREEELSRGREAAEAYRRRSQELLSRMEERTVSDPVSELSESEAEWAPIAHTDTPPTPESVPSETVPYDEPAKYTVNVDGVGVSHSLFIDGMAFGADGELRSEPEPPVSAKPPRDSSRVYGRGVVYEEYGFEDESVEPATPVASEPMPEINPEPAREEPTQSEPRPTSEELLSRDSRRVGKTTRKITPIPCEYEESEADKPEYDRPPQSAPSSLDQALEEEEYAAFLSKERDRRRGACQENPPSEDTIKTTYNAPDDLFLPDEPHPDPDGEDIGYAMSEEEDALAFEKYCREMDRLARENRGKTGVEEYHSEFDIADHDDGVPSPDDEPAPFERRLSDIDTRVDKEATKREIEEDMLRFVREEDRREHERRKSVREPKEDVQPTPEVPIFDKRALLKQKKIECERDVGLMDARLGIEITLLEAERDRHEFTYSEATSKDRREELATIRKIKELKSRLANAKRLENADNERYYLLVLTDFARQKLPKGASVEKLIRMREKLMELLARRDELNTRLTALYLGTDNPKAKIGVMAREDACRKARRKEYSRHKALDRRIRREKPSYDYKKKLYELMDEQIELSGKIAECEFVIKREKPKGERLREVKRALNEYKREYNKNKAELDRLSRTAFKKAKENREKKTGAIFGWIGFFILVAIVIVVVWQWENITTFINENIPTIDEMLPGGTETPDGTETPGDTETPGGTETDTPGGSGDAPDAESGVEGGTESGTDTDGGDAEGGTGSVGV